MLMFPTFKRFHVVDFALLWLCGVFAGMGIGGATNAINSYISREFFDSFADIRTQVGMAVITKSHWKIIQEEFVTGLFGGIAFWIAVSTLFTIYTVVVSRASCPLGVSMRFLSSVAETALLSWLGGGLNGALIGLFIPVAWAHLLEGMLGIFAPWSQAINMGSTSLDRARWLWVGGSTIGVQFGAFAGLIYGCTSFTRYWQRRKATTIPDNAALE